MNPSSNFDMKIFDSIPSDIARQVDTLLKDNESNNRVNDESTLSEYSKERFANKKDRFKYVVVFDGKKVIGIVIVFKRKINFKDKQVLLGGLGGVGTRKEYRGKGIATAMLNEARKILRESGCDIAYINTDIDDPVMLKIYDRVGFQILGRPHVYAGKSGKKYSANVGMIAPVNSDELFQEIRNDTVPFDLGGSNW